MRSFGGALSGNSRAMNSCSRSAISSGRDCALLMDSEMSAVAVVEWASSAVLRLTTPPWPALPASCTIKVGQLERNALSPEKPIARKRTCAQTY
eukprot:6539752-Prymnesium_polylepis.3